MDDVWARVDAELKRRRRDWAWLARELSLSQQLVNNWKRRRVPAARYADIAKLLGWRLDRLLVDPPPLQLAPLGGVDTPRSEPANRSVQARVTPQTVTWGSLAAMDVLPQRFSLVVADDAMPPMRAGHTAIFSTAPAPVGGDTVLVRDSAGDCHIRLYTMRRGNHWLAEARAPGWATLDSIADDLQVLAVQVGHEWG